jgi:peptide/nickel transport system substrate-binding protein
MMTHLNLHGSSGRPRITRSDGATALLALAAGLILAAPSAGYAQGTGKPLVIARNMDLNSLDPHRSFCDTCQIYNSTVFETLLTLDTSNKLVPLLAASWEASADQSKFTFKLDPKAKFSDGSPVEAKDVKWSWERLKNLKGSAAFLAENIAQIDTPDPQTVVVTMAAPNSEFLNIVSAPYMAIVNSKVASANGAMAAADAATKDNAEGWFLQNSPGSGPYVLASYSPNNELRLKRNAQYWRTAPAIEDVVFRQVKDAVAQAQMLESGTADIAMQIDPDTAKTIRSKDLTVQTVPSYNFIYLALSPGAKGNKVKMTKEVREAISLGLNRKEILEFTLGQEGQLISAPIPLGFPGGSGFPEEPYDPAKAKDLLAKANASNLELDAAFPNLNAYGVDLSLLMQKVQQELSKINVKVNLQPLTFSNWREQVSGNGIPLTAVFYAPDYYGSAQYVEYFGMMPGSPWAKRAGAANDPSVINPREQELLKKALATGGEEAATIYHELGLEMIKDRVILPLVSPNLILAHNKSVKGVRYSACCNLPVAEISR